VAFKIRQNPFSAAALPQTPLGELTTLHDERGHPSPYPTPLGTDPPSALGYRAFSLPGQFAPRSESANRTLANSLPGTFAPWPIRSLALSLPGLFAPGNESSMELSLL